MSDEHLNWEQIERELKTLPHLEPRAEERIMQEVRATARRGARGRLRGWLFQPYRVTIAPLSALAGAAAVVILVAGALWLGRGMSERGAAEGTRPEGSAGTQPIQFVVMAPGASRVSLVGDFNGWDASAHPLQQVAAGIWSVVVPLEPGRHEYAYILDGERWIPDASAARAPEDEFGISNSVVLVRGSS